MQQAGSRPRLMNAERDRISVHIVRKLTEQPLKQHNKHKEKEFCVPVRKPCSRGRALRREDMMRVGGRKLATVFLQTNLISV